MPHAVLTFDPTYDCRGVKPVAVGTESLVAVSGTLTGGGESVPYTRAGRRRTPHSMHLYIAPMAVGLSLNTRGAWGRRALIKADFTATPTFDVGLDQVDRLDLAHLVYQFDLNCPRLRPQEVSTRQLQLKPAICFQPNVSGDVSRPITISHPDGGSRLKSF